MRVCVQVKILLDQYDIAGDRVLTFNEFSVNKTNGGRESSKLQATGCVLLQQIMSDLSSHGWRVEGAAAEDMSEVDMKAMFVDADFQRRNSSELMVPPPRKVTQQSTNCHY